MTTRDARTAARRTRREAERYPLLARLGLTKTWTAEEIATTRTQLRALAEQREAESETRFQARAILFRGACSGAVDGETLAEMDRYVERAYPVGAHHAASFWHHAATRLGVGGPAFEAEQVWKAPAPRRQVSDAELLAALARFPAGSTIGPVLDSGLLPGATVLDVLDAARRLRGQGLAEPLPRGPGWRLVPARTAAAR